MSYADLQAAGVVLYVFAPIGKSGHESAVNCARCERFGSFNKEKQSGYCSEFRLMLGTWHDVECPRYLKK